MKNATKNAEELRSYLKRLLKEEKPKPKQTMEPLHALVRGAMSFDVSDARAEDAMKAINREFVDLNELRVATDLEIQELLGTRYPLIEKRVAMITLSLNNIFEREHTLNLDRLKTAKKPEVRSFLRDLPDVHPFVEAYVMLFGFDAPAVPVDEEMLAHLQAEGLADENTTLLDLQKTLEHAVKGEECYDLFTSLRRVSTEAKAKAKKK